jgi:hypothetical protein
MNGFFAGVMLRRLMKGRSVAQIERAFWIVMVTLIALFLAAFIAQFLFAPRQSAGSDSARHASNFTSYATAPPR